MHCNALHSTALHCTALHCTAGCAVSIFILIKLNCTRIAQRTLILSNSKKMNVLFYPYICARDGYRIFWETFPKNDVQLYYIISLSQHTVEYNTFGMMLNRFGVLRSPLGVISILNIGPLIQSIARLHNFLLNENNKNDPHQRQPSQDMPLLPRDEETGQETNGNPAQAR
jgi:hypothetical protein